MQDIRWLGFDYGQTLMDPTHVRTKAIMGVLFLDLEGARPGIIDQKVKRYKELREKYGSYGRLKEAGRDEIYEDVLESNPVLIARFDEIELKLLKPAAGLRDALTELAGMGLSLNIVSEATSGTGLQTIVGFLNRYNLRLFFREIFTGLGRVRPDGTLDESYKGLSKRNGSLWERVAAHLRSVEIQTASAAIVGDHPMADIQMAKQQGFRTICYTGYTGSGTAEADHQISHFDQLAALCRAQTSSTV